MKPHRIRMTHSLVMNYGLYKKMEIFVRPLISLINLAQQLNEGAANGTASETSNEERDGSVPH